MRLPTTLAALMLAVGSASLGSCALLFQGTTESISIDSDPPGATVTLNSGETGVTPFSITVPRNQDLQLHFSKPGYQSADLADNTRVESWIILDILPLMIPWSVDAVAGAGYEHQQSSVIAHLDPEQGAAAATSRKVGAPPAVP